MERKRKRRGHKSKVKKAAAEREKVNFLFSFISLFFDRVMHFLAPPLAFRCGGPYGWTI